MLGVYHTDVARRHRTRTNRYKARRGVQLLPSKGTSPSHYDAALPPDLRDNNNTTSDHVTRQQTANQCLSGTPLWSYPNALTHTWPVPELTPVCHQPVTPGAGLISPISPIAVQNNHRALHRAPTPN